MNKMIVLLFPNLFWLTVYSQNHEEVIESTRVRYYRINSDTVSLTRLAIKNYRYYLEGEQLAIAKWQINEGRFEYYYHQHKGEYVPYFIYFEAGDSSELPDLRAYYDDKGDFYDNKLIRYLEGTKERTDISRSRLYYLYLDAKNAINTFFNVFEHVRHPNDVRVANIRQEVALLKKERTTIDTLSFVSQPDQGHYSHEDFIYKNGKGQPVIRRKAEGGDGGFHGTITFEKEGKILCKIYESSNTYGPVSDTYKTITYYEGSRPFRTDTYRSYGTHIHHKEDEFDLSYSTKYGTGQVVPTIKYISPKEK